MKKPKRMSPAAFHTALITLELDTYDKAAAVLGVGRRSLVRYGIGKQPVPKVLELLLEAYVTNGGVPMHRKMQ